MRVTTKMHICPSLTPYRGTSVLSRPCDAFVTINAAWWITHSGHARGRGMPASAELCLKIDILSIYNDKKLPTHLRVEIEFEDFTHG